MAFAGALPVARNEWHIDAASAGAIQTVFNISSALALFVTSWLSDYYGPRRLYLLFSWSGGAALLAFGLFAHSFHSALLLISFVGITQGGAYTPAVMLAMQMHHPAKRGYAVGMILAAGSLGYLLSLFMATWGALSWGIVIAFYLCSAGAFFGAMLSSLSLKGKMHDPAPVPPARPDTVKGHRKRNTVALLLLIGYVAHCWELLGNWTWTPGLLVASLSPYHLSPLMNGLLIASAIHLSGMLSTLTVGTVSDYFNRTTVLIFMAGAGAVMSLLTGWSASWGAGWVLLFAITGSFFILGDSGVLSAAIADNVAPASLGRVMGIRSLLGFGAGSLAPLCFGRVMDLTGSWKIAYCVLATGGGVAFLCAVLIYLSQRRSCIAETKQRSGL
ncbi:MFS transporter [Klebsiella pneumoniae]|nr:MFS transporter [Klebsiella pneumoniae]